MKAKWAHFVTWGSDPWLSGTQESDQVCSALFLHHLRTSLANYNLLGAFSDAFSTVVLTPSAL